MEKLRGRQRVKEKIAAPGCGGYVMVRGRAVPMPNGKIVVSGGLSGKGLRVIKQVVPMTDRK